MDSSSIRNAFKADIDAVYEIEKNATALWKKEYFIQELENSFSLFIITELNNQVIGYAVAWDVIGEIQLNNIAVHTHYRNKGIGKLMLNYIIDTLKPKGAERIYLEVNEHNKTAIDFYKKTGFTKTGIRKKYYTTADAVLMQMDI